MRSHELFLFFCAVLISSVRAQNFTLTGEEQQQLDVAAGAQIVLRLWTSPGVRSGSWRFNCRDVAVWIGNITDVNNAYSDRAQLFTDGSLSLKSLTVNDSGDYLITMNPVSSNVSVTSLIDLKVIEPVSEPEIVPSVSQTLESNGTVTLNCNVSGDSPSIRWIKDGLYLQYNDRMNVSLDNHTLKITAVNRSDSGNYQCEAYNSVSNKTSDAFFLIVFYGPEEPQIAIDPDKGDITLGSNVTFTCSVQSVPPSEFEWFFNGVPLNKTGQVMTLVSIVPSHSGNYMCQAFNNMTRNYIHVTESIHVVEPVSKPNISSNISDPIEQKDTVALTCHVTGDVRFIYWIKTNQSIQNEERMMLSLDNVTLTIASVNRSDAGDYMCQAWGHTNNEESDPFSLDVSYGPDTPQLTIEDEKEVYAPESDITLRCSADSVPPATFEWLLNGKPLGKTGKKLTLVSITMSDCGNYTCKAHNNHTDSYAEATKEISLVEGITKPKITANASYLVEHNDTVTLTCEVSGHWQTLRWEKNQQVLSGSGNMKVSEGNKTLTISPVDRSDAGNYTCWAETPTITKESDLFKLTIYYGPDEPQVIMAPENQAISPGSNVTLTCKVESFPHSKFRWYQNGVQLPVNDEHLTISNITQSNSSNYTCETYNEKTKLTQQKTRQISLSVRDDLEDYKNKSWIAAAVVGVLVLIAVCACVIFKQRGS
ncbi:carcinoembryonic antigen-related cell adhesion molecule 5-like isoform X1 [Carcharodon carcharias]|uniref:carcinoembryonic antigen-related cell adhesion molecule 5-like isoform X1 n=1 Tax=Carcharodon carcharias TaxID=13397 RepID=UPI001B7F19F4|nr:carcinoembryonic antigen-related cell adhesion molecule 5-like isoform X1 [Carcharodon carcharias]